MKQHASVVQWPDNPRIDRGILRLVICFGEKETNLVVGIYECWHFYPISKCPTWKTKRQKLKYLNFQVRLSHSKLFFFIYFPHEVEVLKPSKILTPFTILSGGYKRARTFCTYKKISLVTKISSRKRNII